MGLDLWGAFLLEPCMRRVTGIYDGVEYVVLEYAGGMVECPSALRALLVHPDDTMPSGAELEQACRGLFGDTLRVREV
jgi:hypothetical protein